MNRGIEYVGQAARVLSASAFMPYAVRSVSSVSSMGMQLSADHQPHRLATPPGCPSARCRDSISRCPAGRCVNISVPFRLPRFFQFSVPTRFWRSIWTSCKVKQPCEATHPKKQIISQEMICFRRSDQGLFTSYVFFGLLLHIIDSSISDKVACAKMFACAKNYCYACIFMVY